MLILANLRYINFCFSDQLRKAFKGVRNEIPLDAVNSYKAILGSALEQGNYFKRFSLLLHCEELQMELDIRNYDMEVSNSDPYLPPKLFWAGPEAFGSFKTILGFTKTF